MCGIFGAIAQRDVAEILVEGLARLEYRGYDSAGIAVVDDERNLTRIRRLGKVKQLYRAINHAHIPGSTGIAHTRWSTHGQPSETNAHPHISGGVAVVHNGIIENHAALRDFIHSHGYICKSQTDTEVIAHLVNWELRGTSSLLHAVTRVSRSLRGSYSIAVLNKDDKSRLVVARSGSSIVIGLGDGENFFASDQLSLPKVTRRFICLEEGDIAEITCLGVDIFDMNGKPVERKIAKSAVKHDVHNKGHHRHFMQKEIYEQPMALAKTIAGRCTEDSVIVDSIGGPGAAQILKHVEHIQIVACGSSYNSGMVAKYWFEGIARVSCDVEIASEFRYRNPVIRPKSLLIALSQSGETADTLAALHTAKGKGYIAIIAVCNVASSSLVRESDIAFMTCTGVEISVASTKAFTAQLAAMLILVVVLGRQKNVLNIESEREIVTALHDLPSQVEQFLDNNCRDIQELTKDFSERSHALFLGRGEYYPIAMEAALKLKEVSYIHAEGCTAGELKHGTLALIDTDMPVIVAAPSNDLLEKLKSNIEEVRARGGLLYIITDEASGFSSNEKTQIIMMPQISKFTSPILYVVPMQLLSYHIACVRGTDPDQPRNLAKSVTVE